GTELLRRCEAYLRERGTQNLHMGVTRPVDPFYFGLYGGSELPGVLDSDDLAAPFLAKNGYKPCQTSLVLQKKLDQTVHIVDSRFPNLRKQLEVRVGPRQGTSTWWQECVVGPVELFDFRLEDKTSNQVAAQAFVWEMEGFSWRWNLPSVG